MTAAAAAFRAADAGLAPRRLPAPRPSLRVMAPLRPGSRVRVRTSAGGPGSFPASLAGPPSLLAGAEGIISMVHSVAGRPMALVDFDPPAPVTGVGDDGPRSTVSAACLPVERLESLEADVTDAADAAEPAEATESGRDAAGGEKAGETGGDRERNPDEARFLAEQYTLRAAALRRIARDEVTASDPKRVRDLSALAERYEFQAVRLWQGLSAEPERGR